MKTLLAALLAFGLAPAWGQALQFNFDALAAKAREKAEIDLSGDLLAQALKDGGPSFAGIAVTRLMVRTYEFARKGSYSDTDLDPLRRQLGSGTGWTRFIDVREEGEHTEMYLRVQDGEMSGLLLIAAEEMELAVILVEGAANLNQLAQLRELVESKIQFDLPEIER
jgi:hypothetical protein